MKLRYSEDAPARYNAGGHMFKPGDVNEVPDGLGETLLQRAHFEPVEADADSDAEAEDADAETCEVEKSDGEVCGRNLPCPYHSDEDSDGEEE